MFLVLILSLSRFPDVLRGTIKIRTLCGTNTKRHSRAQEVLLASSLFTSDEPPPDLA